MAFSAVSLKPEHLFSVSQTTAAERVCKHLAKSAVKQPWYSTQGSCDKKCKPKFTHIHLSAARTTFSLQQLTRTTLKYMQEGGNDRK